MVEIYKIGKNTLELEIATRFNLVDWNLPFDEYVLFVKLWLKFNEMQRGTPTMLGVEIVKLKIN